MVDENIASSWAQSGRLDDELQRYADVLVEPRSRFVPARDGRPAGASMITWENLVPTRDDAPGPQEGRD